MFITYGLLFVSLANNGFVVAKSGTTPHIKDVFVGRCWQYQTLENQNKIPVLKTTLNCTELWTTFYRSFAHKDPCNITQKSYTAFFNMIDTSKKISNALFWSGSHELVQDYTFINDDYIALEDTITGYLFDGLQWCGSTTSPDGMNSSYCSSNSRSCNAMHPVWFIASAKFAERANGTAHTLLNATRSKNKPSYYHSSFFRTVEMPRLRVDKLVVLVASSIGQPVRETCASSRSLQELRQDAKRSNIVIECIDQPKLVLQIFCLKYPRSAACVTTSYQSGNNESKEKLKKWKILAVVFSVICIALLLGVALWAVFLHFGKKGNSLQISPAVSQGGQSSVIVTCEPTKSEVDENDNKIWL